MPPEAEVIDPPPAGKTSIAEKFQAEMAKLQPPVEDKPPTPPEKKEETPPKKEDKTPSKPGSALEAAIGEHKPAEEKKVELPKWEDEPVVKEIDSSKEKNFGVLRQKLGEQSLEIKRLSGEIDTAKKAGTQVDPKIVEDLTTARKEIETLKATLSQRDESIKAINAEYSEDFRSLLADRDKAVQKAVSRFKAYGGDGEALADVLQLPEGKVKNEKLKEVFGDIELEGKTRVLALVEQIDDANDKIADFKKDLPGKWEEIKARQDEQTRKQSEREKESVATNFDRVAKMVPHEAVLLREIDADVPGADKWNADVKAAFDNGLRIIQGNGSTFDESVAVAIKGSDYDRVVNLLLEARKELTTANGRLAEFDQGGPDFHGGKRPGEEGVKKTPGQKYHETMTKLSGGGGSDDE